MTFDEMIARAEQMRSRDLYGAVSPEELRQYPAIQAEFQLASEDGGEVHIYKIMPENRPMGCPMIINFHGGGFIKGRQLKDQLFCSKLALAFQCLVWDVDYSLAPERPYPAAVEESYSVVSYAFAHADELGIDVSRILLIGHSAGGNLAATVCMKASETKAFHPAGLVMGYSPLDLYTDPALKPRVEGDMPAETAKAYNAFYHDSETAKNPYVSPIFADECQLEGFPDTLIFSCGLDSLCYEDEEFAMKLSRSGVNVISRRFKNSLHGFTLNRTEEWEDGMALMFDFIKHHFEC